MPQGTVIPIKPATGAVNAYAWVEGLQAFLNEDKNVELTVGIIEVCQAEGESILVPGEKLLYIVPRTGFPSVVPGYCENLTSPTVAKPTVVDFVLAPGPFKYINKVTKG